ncbi:hypothetical protein GGI42DRAFT_310701 [Trichoderma sp. SZMC 28013]
MCLFMLCLVTSAFQPFPPSLYRYPFPHLSNQQRANRSNQIKSSSSTCIRFDITHTSRLGEPLTAVQFLFLLITAPLQPSPLAALQH